MMKIIAMLVCLAMFAVAFMGCGHFKKPLKDACASDYVLQTDR